MAGGAIVEAVAIWGCLAIWQKARHAARASGRRQLPPLADYVDPPADSLVALTRVILGGLAGLLLHAQVSGTLGAIAVGASAPALLGQLGAMRTVQQTTGGGEAISAALPETGSALADLSPHSSREAAE